MGLQIDGSSPDAERTEAEVERQLLAARDSFAGWDIIETFGGYLAVPRGNAIIHSTTVDGLVMKLRQRQPHEQ